MRRRNRWACSYAETAEDHTRLDAFAAGRGWQLVRRYGAGQWEAFLRDLKNIAFGCARRNDLWWIGSSDLDLLNGAPPVAKAQQQRLDEFLSIQEVARHLGVHEDTIYRACYSGKLKYIRVGRKLRVSVASVNRWFTGRRA
jgi:excisionase family DNA binding protein